MSPTPSAGEWQFHLSGDALCLDFANTVSWRRSSAPIERLTTYKDLVSWARQARLISRLDAARLSCEATDHPGQASRRLASARDLRELIFRIFAAITERRPPNDRDLDRLNAGIQPAFANRRLIREGSTYHLRSTDRAHSIDQIIGDIVRSAAQLLTSDELALVGQCHGRDCRWLFVDRTRNRSRRWCDMAVCGNRTKAQRHYRRKRLARR